MTEEQESASPRRRSYIAAAIGGAAGVAVAAAGVGLVQWYQAAQMEEPEAVEEEAPPDEAVSFEVPALEAVEAASVEALLARLREQGNEAWPPDGGEVVPVTAPSFPDDLDEARVEQRKEVFFRVLTPLILAENARLREARAFVEELAAVPEGERSEADQARLESLAEHYRVSAGEADFPERLLHRLDEIPVDMALAQAANESGWGTSRFTREANNLFGEWTWTQEAGIVPERRGEGQTHRIRVFEDLQGAVRGYAYNLNVGHAYEAFRDQRAEMRQREEPLDGHALSSGLVAYSERGEDYVDEVRSMIRFNDLSRYRELELAPVERREVEIALEPGEEVPPEE